MTEKTIEEIMKSCGLNELTIFEHSIFSKAYDEGVKDGKLEGIAIGQEKNKCGHSKTYCDMCVLETEITQAKKDLIAKIDNHKGCEESEDGNHFWVSDDEDNPKEILCQHCLIRLRDSIKQKEIRT